MLRRPRGRNAQPRPPRGPRRPSHVNILRLPHLRPIPHVLITGRFPHENEVWTNDQALDSAIPTYAHALGAAGYRPVQIGRMHFNGPDQLHGFAERLVGDHSPNWPGSRVQSITADSLARQDQLG